MNDKLSTFEVACKVEAEDLGYCIQFGLSTGTIQDTNLAKKWAVCKALLTEIDDILQEALISAPEEQAEVETDVTP